MFHDTSESKTKQIKELQLQSERNIFYNNLRAGQENDTVRVLKSLTTRECKKIVPVDKLFQRSFYDHIIRDEYDYQIKWQYIDDNPIKWQEDSLYVEESK